MQFLFSLSRDEKLDFKEISKRYWQSIELSYSLYIYNIFVLLGIIECAKDDLENRKSKHLPTDYDKAFSDKLHKNPLVTYLKNNKELQKNFESNNFGAITNEDYYKKIYTPFSKTSEYKDYITSKSTPEKHLSILLDLYRYCRKDEFFNELMEDAYTQWIDDKSVVVGAVKKTLKEIPNDDTEFFRKYYPDDETVKEFGFELLKYTFENDEKLLEHIKPTLKNWDHERLAIIDMILLKMALSEFLYFPTIPTTVTLNEYVEVSKGYSTAKSKDFINGILDRLRKDFEEKDMINKVDSEPQNPN
jgi:N utilization substance protein B